ncbi:MAG: hypothetical protein J7L94_08645 [Caldisericaceae bacterium]|nr:hypothetical protein [Caldisericaceae bacterium]
MFKKFYATSFYYKLTAKKAKALNWPQNTKSAAITFYLVNQNEEPLYVFMGTLKSIGLIK